LAAFRTLGSPSQKGPPHDSSAGQVERSFISNTIQAGTILVQESTLLHSLGTQGENYSDEWCSLGTTESTELDRKLRAAGWNFFFIADELRTILPPWGGEKTLRTGVKRLLARTRAQQFNCMQLSNILRERFLGIPFVSVVAHARHVQQGSRMEGIEQRTSRGNGSKPK
jgi:hypothetical protein